MAQSRETTVWVLGDQLSLRISAFEGLSPSECVVLMVESLARARRLPYHKQKLTLVWSSMRHFAQELIEKLFKHRTNGVVAIAIKE